MLAQVTYNICYSILYLSFTYHNLMDFLTKPHQNYKSLFHCDFDIGLEDRKH